MLFMTMQSIRVGGKLEDALNSAIEMGFAETKSEFIRTAIFRYALDLQLFDKRSHQKKNTLNLVEMTKREDIENKAKVHGFDMSKFSELSEKEMRENISEKCTEFLKSNQDQAWLTKEIADKVGVGWRQIVSPLSKLTRDAKLERKYDGRTPYYHYISNKS